MSPRKRLLARQIAVLVVLFSAVAVNAAWAEDAASGSNQRDVLPGRDDTGSAAHGTILDTKASGGSFSGEGDGGTKGNEKTKVDEKATDKVDTSTGNMGERHTGSTGSARGEEGTDSKGGRHGEDHAGTKPSGTDLGEIDTRITVFGRPRFGRSKAHDWKKSKIARPSGNSRDGHRTWTRAKNGVVRNAIGQPTQRTSTGIKATDVKASEWAGVDGTPKSPAGNGGTEAGGADTHRQGFVPLRAGGVTPQDPRINTAMNHSSISGRDMIRPGLGASAIGGVAKNNSGVISGIMFRPKHP
jgi:hypothetical protein